MNPHKKHLVIKYFTSEGWNIIVDTDDAEQAQQSFSHLASEADREETVLLVEVRASSAGVTPLMEPEELLSTESLRSLHAMMHGKD